MEHLKFCVIAKVINSHKVKCPESKVSIIKISQFRLFNNCTEPKTTWGGHCHGEIQHLFCTLTQ